MTELPQGIPEAAEGVFTVASSSGLGIAAFTLFGVFILVGIFLWKRPKTDFPKEIKDMEDKLETKIDEQIEKLEAKITGQGKRLEEQMTKRDEANSAEHKTMSHRIGKLETAQVESNAKLDAITTSLNNLPQKITEKINAIFNERELARIREEKKKE